MAAASSWEQGLRNRRRLSSSTKLFLCLSRTVQRQRGVLAHQCSPARFVWHRWKVWLLWLCLQDADSQHQLFYCP